MLNSVTRDDPRPLYKQVKARLVEALESGLIPPHSKLASERELVEQYGVSRITIRQAMTELVREGLLRSHPGKGFYATGRRRGSYELELMRSFTATAMEHGRNPGSRLLTAAIEPASEGTAQQLEVEAGTPVISLRRLRLIDGEAVAISHDWLLPVRVPGLLDLDWANGNRSLYAELASRYGLVPHNGHTLLSARLADAAEARLLDLKPPAALLSVEQIAYDVHGSPINHTISLHHPTRYPLRLDQEQRAG